MPKEIKHFHYTRCESTQDLLSEYTKENPSAPFVLYSTLFQSLGRGRQGNKWNSLENSLAMSFVIEPNSVLSLTSLEIGILLCDFFKNYNLKLKWPNDLLTIDGYKCGGILCQNQSNRILVGIGLNLGKSQQIEKSTEYKFGRSSLCEEDFSEHQLEVTSKELYTYVIHNRLTAEQVRERWIDLCFHSNQLVRIEDETFSVSGIFKGIGPMGEALIETEGQEIKKLYSGSLFLD